MEKKNFSTRLIYLLFIIPTIILAALAFIMSVMGLGMIAFVPGSIATLLALIAYFLFNVNKKLTKIIGFIAVFSIVFAGFRTLIFEPKLADDAENNTETIVTEEELNSDLGEAFGDMDFGDEAAEKPIQAADKIYAAHCARCHQPDGMGIPDKFPPLAQADYLENRLASISAVIHGMSGENVINDKIYTATMPKPELNEKELVAVINYIFSSWGNDIAPTSFNEVKKIKTLK